MARKVIALLGKPVQNEDGVAGEAITPCHLVSGVSTIIKNASANDAAPARTFALERDELGDDIDDAYASGDRVKVGSFAPGQRVYAWLASGNDAEEGEFLASNGDGTLKVYASGARIARALEDLDLSGEAVATRIRVEIY